MEGLREEALDFARAGNQELVIVGELVDAQDGDDILQILVALEDPFHLQGNAVVLGADDIGIQEPGGGGERIHRRVQPLLRNGALQRDCRIQVAEDRHRRRVGVVIGRDVDGLHRGDGSQQGGGNPFLQAADVLRERRLVADGGRHASQQRRHLAARLREAEHVVDEEEHVDALLVPEVFRHGERRQPDTEPVSRRLVHLAEDQDRLVQDFRLLHLQVEIGSLARPLSDAGEDGVPAVLYGDVADELLHDDGLPDSCAAENADLAAPGEGGDEVDDLDSRFQHLGP